VTFRIGVAGASGYSGAELLRLLAGHPDLEVVVATSREFAGRAIADVYPSLAAYGEDEYTALDPVALERCDLVFLALPHGASMDIGARMASAGVRVVDFSADFRLNEPAAYPQWFGAEHTNPGWLGKWIYGLPELRRDEIRGGALVANPGCYSTAALLALAPLVAARVVDLDHVVISAASGVSGAGRSLSAASHFSHVDANFRAYGFPSHKHTPEIEQELSRLAGSSVQVTFIPHLVPMPRGLLATCVAPIAGMQREVNVADEARSFYRGEPFVRVLEGMRPETKLTSGSNLCLLGYSVDERTRTVVAVAAIDNLGKGAAGQALQNANLMLGLTETTGLLGGGVYP
jgi:N-acetyl-gamma-glutamyl-phosphate reductase